jgi:integrase
MSTKDSAIPSYRRHRATGQAVVTLNGRDIYLGKFGTPESKARYDAAINEWLAGGRHLPDSRKPGEERLVKELIHGYHGFCCSVMPDVEVAKVRTIMRVVRGMYGETPAAKFGVIQFKAVRQKLVDDGLSISTIRDRMGVVRRMVQWGVENEILPADTLMRIKSVSSLRARRDGVKPARKIRPVAEADVRAVMEHVGPAIAAMLELQLCTGARPGEICRMTTGQIHRSGDEWEYRPVSHKNMDRDQERVIPLGPQAQRVLIPFLKADPDAPLFCPREVSKAHYEAHKRPHRTERQRARKRRRTPRVPKMFYDKNSYRQAIIRGCDRAGVSPFRANQIRHTVLTKVRQDPDFGPEHAQALGGHSKINTTQRYAELNRDLAKEVVRKFG